MDRVVIKIRKKPNPYKLVAEIASQCCQWGEAGNTKGQLVPPGWGGKELTRRGAWMTAFEQRGMKQPQCEATNSAILTFGEMLSACMSVIHAVILSYG